MKIERLRMHAGGLAPLAMVVGLASLAWSPAAAAQERMEERGGRGRVLWLTADARPMLGVYLDGDAVGGGDGAAVRSVSPGGPAEAAGILEGDVIVSVGGHLLSEPLDQESWSGAAPWSPARRLRAVMSEVRAGEPVEVGIDRDGESLTLTVVPEALATSLMRPTLDTLTIHLREASERWRERMEEIRDRYAEIEWPDLPTPGGDLGADAAPGFGLDRFGDWRRDFAFLATHGLDLIDLNPGLGAYFGTSEGVLVADAEEGSPLGLVPGDVVVEVEGRTVDDVAELRRILASYTRDEEIAFKIWRDGAETTIVGTIDPVPPDPAVPGPA